MVTSIRGGQPTQVFREQRADTEEEKKRIRQRYAPTIDGQPTTETAAEVTYRVGQAAPDLSRPPTEAIVTKVDEGGKPIYSTETKEVRDTRTGKLEGFEDPTLRQSFQAPVTKVKKDEVGRIVEVDGQKAAAGTFFTRASVEEYGEGRTEQLRKNISLMALSQTTQMRLDKATTPEHQQQILAEYRAEQFELYTGKEYDVEAERTRQGVLTQEGKLKPEHLVVDMSKVNMYGGEGIEDIYAKTREKEKILFGLIEREKPVTKYNIDELHKELEESNFYAIRSRPLMVTTGKEELKLQELERKGLYVESKLSSYGAKQTIGNLAKVPIIAVGGTYVAKAVGLKIATAKPVVKTIAKVGGRVLQAAYVGSVGLRGYQTYKLAKEDKKLGALYSGVSLGTELVSVGIMTKAMKPKTRFDKETIIHRDKKGGYTFKRAGTVDKKILGGKFKQDIAIEGYVTKTQKIAYKTTTTYKGKTISQVFGRINPTDYKLTKIDDLTYKLSAKYQGYETIKGVKGKKRISFEGDILTTKLTGKEVKIPTGAKRLYGIKQGDFNPQIKRGIEGLTVDVVRTDKGLFIERLTPTKTQSVGGFMESKKLKVSFPKEVITDYGRTTYQLGRIPKRVLITQASFLSTAIGGGGMSASSLTATKTDLRLSKVYPQNVYLITPTLETTLAPLPLSYSKQDTRFKTIELEESKIETKSKLQTIVKSKPSQLQEYLLVTETEQIVKPMPLVIPKVALEQKTETIPDVAQEVIQEQGQELQQELIQQPEQLVDQETVAIPDTVPPLLITPFLITPPLPKPEPVQRPSSLGEKGKPFETRYAPSLLGIERQSPVTKTKGFTGFEVRGVPKAQRIKKAAPTYRFGGLDLQPIKSGRTGMKLKITKTKKKPKFKIEEGGISRFFKNAGKVKLK